MKQAQSMARGAVFGMAASGLLGAGAALAAAPAQEIATRTARGLEVIPASSIARPEDAGIRSHTNVRILFRDGRRQNSTPITGFETPASLACVYGLVAPTTGCNPTTATTVLNTGSKLVVIVDAFDYPTAAADLAVYSQQYGLPAITANNFQVVYASGTKPGTDSTGGWEFEEALDIEMAHAMAPNAKIVLMEAASNSNTNLYAGVQAAAKLVTAAGGGEVSNSWGGGESSGENSNESVFTGTNVVFFASSGDSPGTISPSVLQNVVAAGGTNIVRDSSYNYENQTTWDDAGSGLSAYVPVPSYQSAEKKVSKIVGQFRGTPDFSFDSGPASPVSVYDTTPYNGSVLDWTGAYGTSVASPALAGIVNSAGSFAASTQAELTTVYKGYKSKANWTDIVSGTCGENGALKAKKGYDLCTGIGVVKGFAGK